MKILLTLLLLTSFGACELMEDSLSSLSNGSGLETDTDSSNGGDSSGEQEDSPTIKDESKVT